MPRPIPPDDDEIVDYDEIDDDDDDETVEFYDGPEPSSELKYFCNDFHWRRSARGNLWREYDGMTLSIFQRRGMYAWSWADEDGPHFSRSSFETEEEAIEALAETLGVE